MSNMVLGGKIADLTSNKVPLETYKDCLAMIICNPPQPVCYLNECDEFQDADPMSKFKKKLRKLIDDNMIDTITYKQWVSVHRSTLETVSNSSDDFLDAFCDKLEILLRYSLQDSSHPSKKI